MIISSLLITDGGNQVPQFLQREVIVPDVHAKLLKEFNIERDTTITPDLDEDILTSSSKERDR